MWRLTLFKRKRQGFALVFVILIALAMIIPAMMIASSNAPRRKAVTGEAISDRSLTVADATVDKILNKINTFPFTFKASSIIDGYDPSDPDPDSGTYDISSGLAQDYLIYYYISQLNGGVVPDIPYPATTEAVTQFEQSCTQISGYVSTYLYNLQTQEYYAVWDSTNDKIASVSSVGPDGDVKTGVIKNLNTGGPPLSGGMEANFPDYKKDNLWVEIDTNTQYWPGTPDEWDIKATAYLMDKPKIKRTIEAIANRGTPSVGPAQLANGSWFTHNTTTVTVPGHSFADYSGLYHTKVYFGRFETTTGPIRSDANLYMGGWAKNSVYAHGTVYDKACDDGWNHDGRFGPGKKNLTWAKNNGYATDGYPKAVWANGDAALLNLKNEALSSPSYYVSGDANIVFSVVTDADGNKVGKVKINGTTYDMPTTTNGAIFVEGTATVSGTVKGQCSVGASKINIGGNIVYDTPPRLDRNAPIPENPDLLGLISHGDIEIPAATFYANHHLEIDAAMFSESGSFRIDPTVDSHSIDPSGEYEAWWNGCQAEWNASYAPARYIGGGRVKGYEIQHTNYDWNLRDYGVPPFYPVTSTTDEHTDIIDEYPVVTNPSILNVLTQLHEIDLTPTGDPTYPYSYSYDGNDGNGVVTYYYGGTFNWSAVATMNKTPLYRISWKEQIANPVKPEP